jgi:hypothetical protein
MGDDRIVLARHQAAYGEPAGPTAGVAGAGVGEATLDAPKKRAGVAGVGAGELAPA